MTCQDLVKYLSDYIDHELDESLAREADEHLATCENCHLVLDTTQLTISLLRRSIRPALAPERRARLFAELERVAGRRSS
jgi:anti-sigma factor RsiW